MINITAQDINKLRKITGVGMMDCKHALTEAEGDFNKAIEIIRKKGQKIASKRADRETNEGIAIAKTNDINTCGICFILSCETDFVAKNEDFIKAADDIMNVSIKYSISDVSELMGTKLLNKEITVNELLNDLVSKIQEKIKINDFFKIETPFVYVYNHYNRKISTVVGFNSKVHGIENAAKEIAMQITASNPIAIDSHNVSPEIIEKELEIAREITRKEGKPDDMIEKIAQGKLNKFFKENTLLEQPLFENEKITVKEYLQSIDKELIITAFHRLSVSD